MNLIERLQNFDGKLVEPLEDLAEELATGTDDVDQLLTVASSDDAKLQVAATWVLKRLVESDLALSQQQTREVLRLLKQVEHWEARLHLLQMLDKLAIPSRKAAGLFKRLKQLVGDENKLVRAWAYNGLFVLGDQQPRYRDEVVELLQEAEQDPAASVKARVRRICKQAEWAKIS